MTKKNGRKKNDESWNLQNVWVKEKRLFNEVKSLSQTIEHLLFAGGSERKRMKFIETKLN